MSPTWTAPWAAELFPGETDASLFGAPGQRRTGAAAPRARASRRASPGSAPRPPAATVAGQRRCISSRSTGDLCRGECTGRTSGGNPPDRTSRTEATPAPHTLHATLWQRAADRVTSRPIAGAPRHTGTLRQMGLSVSAEGPFVFLGEPFDPHAQFSTACQQVLSLLPGPHLKPRTVAVLDSNSTPFDRRLRRRW